MSFAKLCRVNRIGIAAGPIYWPHISRVTSWTIRWQHAATRYDNTVLVLTVLMEIWLLGRGTNGQFAGTVVTLVFQLNDHAWGHPLTNSLDLATYIAQD